MIRIPKFTPPPGACDSHIHVYEDRRRYPSLLVNGCEMEDLFLEDYLSVRDALGLSRTVIVQSPHYGTDNCSLLSSIARLGQGKARGIAITVPDVSETALGHLHEAGVRGLRFGIELVRGMRPLYLEDIASRIAPLGWHIQYRSTEKDLPLLVERFAKLPVDVVIDHIGSIPPRLGTNHPAFTAMMWLLEGGRCWVKLSAPYQLSKTGGPHYADYREFARLLVAAAPERLLWGTNWPHPKVDFMPNEVDLLETLLDWVDSDATRQRILCENPAQLYGFENVDQGNAYE